MEEVVQVIFEKANKFLDALLPLPPQRDLTPGVEYALFPFAHRNRTEFDYFAPSTKFFRGISLDKLGPDATQTTSAREAVFELIKASVSDEGYKKINQIRLLEKVLTAREAANPRNPRFIVRNPDYYYVSIFGTLTTEGKLSADHPWGWRLEGHHLSLHWTIVSGKIVSSTPQFIGTQPMVVKQGEGVSGVLPGGEHIDLPDGSRVLGIEEALAWDLIKTLTPTQLDKAWISVPWDNETNNAKNSAKDRTLHRLEDRGILYSDLNLNQQEILQNLIRAHASIQHHFLVEERLRKIENAGWARLKFSFQGGPQISEIIEAINSGNKIDYFGAGRSLAYRIRHIDLFVIEYVNKAYTAPEFKPDHQHAVWRDFHNDWGLNHLPTKKRKYYVLYEK